MIYSPHVLILEGIFALHDPRILELLDLKVSQLLFPISSINAFLSWEKRVIWVLRNDRV